MVDATAKEESLHVGYTIFEQNSIVEPDKVYGEEMQVLTSLYGFTTEDLDVSLKQGRAENKKYIIEPIFDS